MFQLSALLSLAAISFSFNLAHGQASTQLFELTSDLAVNKQLKNDDTVNLSNSGKGTIYFKCINPQYEAMFGSEYEGGNGEVNIVSMSPSTIKKVDYKIQRGDKIKFICSTLDPKIDPVTVYGVSSGSRLSSYLLVTNVPFVLMVLTMFKSYLM